MGRLRRSPFVASVAVYPLAAAARDSDSPARAWASSEPVLLMDDTVAVNAAVDVPGKPRVRPDVLPSKVRIAPSVVSDAVPTSEDAAVRDGGSTESSSPPVSLGVATVVSPSVVLHC